MNISIPTFILIVLFSIGSWIDINSIFSQLSFLVTTLPESTELYSYFALIIQSANICPLIYGILRKYYPKYMDEKIAIFTILVGCTISMVIVAYIHNVVVDIFYGRSSSLPLFFMVFIIASLDCLSTITFYPYMSLFSSSYLPAYYIGQSMSGLISSFLTLIQGNKEAVVPCPSITYKNLFCGLQKCINTTTIKSGNYYSTRIYFLLISACLAVSLISFIIINNSSHVRKHMSMTYDMLVKQRISSNTESNREVISKKSYFHFFSSFFDSLINHFKILKKDTCLLLFIIFWISFLSNGVIVQIMSFTAFPYKGNTLFLSSNLYILSQALTNIGLLFKKFSNRMAIVALSSFYTLLCCIMIAISVYAKHALTIPNPYGSIIVITLYILSGISFSTIRLVVGTELRNLGVSAMFMCGVCTQLGSFSGTLLTFIPVSVMCVFNT